MHLLWHQLTTKYYPESLTVETKRDASITIKHVLFIYTICSHHKKQGKTRKRVRHAPTATLVRMVLLRADTLLCTQYIYIGIRSKHSSKECLLR